jgi:hypothetical protein
MKPYVFHMNWTHNKTDKRLNTTNKWENGLLLRRAYGLNCKTYSKTNQLLTEQVSGGAPHLSSCCSAGNTSSIYHFGDRPSKIPCHDSPFSSWEVSFLMEVTTERRSAPHGAAKGCESIQVISLSSGRSKHQNPYQRTTRYGTTH